MTIFPDIFSPLYSSIIKRAMQKGKAEIFLHNLRDYTSDPHKTVDDAPYGGGAGMVMKVDILCKAIDDLKEKNSGAQVIFLSPQGSLFNQKKARELSELSGMILVCAHYEGVDERFVELACDEELSIGDYVLTGGEIPAMVVTDCVVRLIPGVIDEESVFEDSFTNGLLDYPHYTRPSDFRGKSVPEVLLSGDHARIKQWRLEQKFAATLKKRPELLSALHLNKEEENILKRIIHKP